MRGSPSHHSTASSLYGGDGADVINASKYSARQVASYIEAGKGNDTVTMGGLDNMVYRVGDGLDTVFFKGSGDNIKIEDLRLSELVFSRVEYSSALLIANKHDIYNDQILLKNYFSSSSNRPKINVRNESGENYTIVDNLTIDAFVKVGNELDNYIIGSAADDNINGYGGNDLINGGLATTVFTAEQVTTPSMAGGVFGVIISMVGKVVII